MTMKRFIRRRPRPATIIAIVALIVALAGTAVAAGPFLPKSKFANFKGNALKGLTYVSNTESVPVGTGATDFTRVSANCPSGLTPVGGGVKLSPNNVNLRWDDGYLTTTGYASHVHNETASSGTAVVTVACVRTKTTGAPPSS
jgi:hypothetical protein